MSSRSLSQLAIIGLLLIGGLGITARQQLRETEQIALADSLWLLTYEVSFKATGDSTQVEIALPQSSDTIRVDGPPEVFYQKLGGKLEGDTIALPPSGTERLRLRTNQTSPEPLLASAIYKLRLRPGGGFGKPPLINLSGDALGTYLNAIPTLVPKNSKRVRELLGEAQNETTSDEELLQWIFDYCSPGNLPSAPAGHSDDVLGTLDSKKATDLGRSRLMVTLCRAADFPARLVTGFELRQQIPFKPHTWVEVFRDDRWMPFDPTFGWARSLPTNYLTVRREGKDGRQDIVKSRRDAQAEDLKDSYTLVRLGPDESVLHRDEKRFSQMFDLTRLPIEMHEVLSLLLLLPIGALITAFFRNIVGIPTFGTFAPALFAISFTYADWGSGLVILAVVLLAGTIGRALVGQLRLLMVPRLSIILTSIILCVVFGVSMLDYLDWTPSAKAVLLPLVIVTVLIERLYVTVEEDGFGFAVQLAAGTLFVSAACYLVLAWDKVGEAILVYPEAHLITIALFIAIGRYAGYRLIEMWRFRDLVGKG